MKACKLCTYSEVNLPNVHNIDAAAAYSTKIHLLATDLAAEVHNGFHVPTIS